MNFGHLLNPCLGLLRDREKERTPRRDKGEVGVCPKADIVLEPNKGG